MGAYSLQSNSTLCIGENEDKASKDDASYSTRDVTGIKLRRYHRVAIGALFKQQTGAGDVLTQSGVFEPDCYAPDSKQNHIGQSSFFFPFLLKFMNASSAVYPSVSCPEKVHPETAVRLNHSPWI
jgi:hypothetical protein